MFMAYISKAWEMPLHSSIEAAATALRPIAAIKMLVGIARTGLDE